MEMLPREASPADQVLLFLIFFFFNATVTTDIYTLSLHDALPISPRCCSPPDSSLGRCRLRVPSRTRSEEHTSELQSHSDLVCRLLLEKKNHIAIAQGKTKVRPLSVYHGKVGRGLSVEMSVKHGPV